MINYRELQLTFKKIYSLKKEESKLNQKIIKRCNELILCLPSERAMGTIDECSTVEFCEYNQFLSSRAVWQDYNKPLVMVCEKDEYGTEIYYVIPRHFFDIELKQAKKEGQEIEDEYIASITENKNAQEYQTYLTLKEKYE